MKKILSLMQRCSETSIGLFPKTFISLILAMTLFIIAASVVIYSISKESLEREVNLSNLDTLKQTRIAVDSILESTEHISLQVARNQTIPQFWDKPLSISAYSDVKILENVVNVIRTHSEGIQYIDRISVYSFLNNALVSNEGSTYKEMNKTFLDTMDVLLKKGEDSIWLDTNSDIIIDGERNTIRFIKFIYGMNKLPKGFVLISLKNNEFMNLVQNIYIRKSGYISIINEYGKVIIDRNKEQESNSIAFIDIDLLDGLEGYKKIKNGFEELLISYTTSEHNNWKYVAVLSVNELDNKAYVVRNIIIVISLLFIILSVFVSFAVTRGIYNPIILMQNLLTGEVTKQSTMNNLKKRKDELGRINREISNVITQLSKEKAERVSISEENIALKAKLDDNVSMLKEYYLYRIICGDISEKEDIVSQAAFLNISLKAIYIVMIVEFDKSFDDVMLNMDDEKQNVVKMGVLNIFNKAMSNVAMPVKVFYEAKERNERIIGIICFDDETSIQEINSIKVMCNFIQNIIADKFDFTVTIAVGSSYSGIESIRKSYNEAVQMLKYKFILGNNAIIFKDEIDIDSISMPQQYYYKKHIKNCLSVVNLYEIKKVLYGFKDSMKKNAYNNTECVYFCKDIINILIEHLREIKYANYNDIQELNRTFLNFDREFESIDESIDWIYGFIKMLFSKIDKEKPNEYSKTVKDALKIIRCEYNKDISLTYMAYKLKISETYFSKLFKNETGKRFIGYLTEYRIEKAKELLKTTYLSIQEISKRVGYNNYSQFTRMFKKHEGIIANEYRNLVRPPD